jgi:Zinc knuckle
VTGKDIYPATLVEAINSITKFHRGAKTEHLTNPAGTVYTTLAAVTEDKPRGKPRDRNDKKSRPDKGKSTPEPSLGGEKDKDWKSKVKCHHCGKLGHLKRECCGMDKDITFWLCHSGV